MFDGDLISGLAWAPYRLPLRDPWSTSSHSRTARTGVLVELEIEGAARGVGEAAPLEERGAGTSVNVSALLREGGEDWLGQASAALDRTRDWLRAGRPGARALHCALETALLDARAQSAGVALASLLGGSGARRAGIAVSAAVTAPEVDAAVGATTQALAAGYPSLKLKVGQASSETDERDRIAAVLDAAGDMAVHLDANGAWSESRAKAILRPLRHRIAYVEQPVASHAIEALARLRRDGQRVAADEAVSGATAAAELLAREAVDLLVVKPLGLDGPLEAMQIAEMAAQQGVDVALGGVLGSGVDAAVVLQIAAATNSPKPCGLGPLDWIDDQLLLRPLERDRGTITLPGGAGLGVDVRWSAPALGPRQQRGVFPPPRGGARTRRTSDPGCGDGRCSG